MRARIKFLFFVWVLALGTSASAQTLRLILMSDLRDPELGRVSLNDNEEVINMCRLISGSLRYTLDITYLDGEKFTSKAFREQMATFKASPSDILFFYYSGKGYYPSGGRSFFPHLSVTDFRRSPLSMDEVGRTLNTKKARLAFVIADCRARFAEPSDGIREGIGFREDFTALAIHKLFAETCGLYSACSSRAGQEALAIPDDERSVFTSSLRKALVGITRNTTPRNAHEQTLNDWFSRTQQRVNWELWNQVKSPKHQTLRLARAACTQAQERLTVKLPSLRHVATAPEFTEDLRAYLLAKTPEEKRARRERILQYASLGAAIRLTEETTVRSVDQLRPNTESVLSLRDFFVKFEAPQHSEKVRLDDILFLKRSSDWSLIEEAIVYIVYSP